MLISLSWDDTTVVVKYYSQATPFMNINITILCKLFMLHWPQ